MGSLLLIVACSSTGQATDVPSTVATTMSTTTLTTPVASTSIATSTVASTTVPAITNPAVDMGDLVGWDIASITVGGRKLWVAIADEPGEHAQGLMGVERLGDLDGMLFVFSQELLGGFWMKGTLIALDIAFFDDDRTLVDSLSMVPCAADPCPSYVPAAPYSWALETPAGALPLLPEGTILLVDG